MGIVERCPACGFVSPEIRCPRCNALKLVGCTGVCSACASSCAAGAASAAAGCDLADTPAADEKPADAEPQPS